MSQSSQQNTESGVYIQPSRRPDGSIRKAIRVKAGYVPQDEVPLYESKGKQFSNRQSYLPEGLDPSHVKKQPVNPNNPIPGLVVLDEDLKKKNKKKKSKSESANNTSSNSNSNNNSSKKSTSKKAPTSDAEINNLTSDELEKKIKNLKKKVREIKTLEQKVENGEIKNLEKDQRDKLNRKADLLSEIMALQLCLHNDVKRDVED